MKSVSKEIHDSLSKDPGSKRSIVNSTQEEESLQNSVQGKIEKDITDETSETHSDAQTLSPDQQ